MLARSFVPLLALFTFAAVPAVHAGQALPTDCAFGLTDRFGVGSTICATGDVDNRIPTGSSLLGGTNYSICPEGYVYILPAGYPGFADASSTIGPDGGPIAGENYVVGCGTGGSFFEILVWNGAKAGSYEMAVDEYPFGPGPEDGTTRVAFTVSKNAPAINLIDVAQVKARAEESRLHMRELELWGQIIKFVNAAAIATDVSYYGAGAFGLYFVTIVACEQSGVGFCPFGIYPDFQALDGLIALTVSLQKQYQGIVNDPPDPNFFQLAPLDLEAQGLAPFLPFPSNDEKVRRQIALTQLMAIQSGAYAALLPTLEKLQGADAANDPLGRLLQAEKVIAYASLALEANDRMSSELDALEQALSLSGALMATTDGADLNADVQRVLSTGLYPDEISVIKSFGFSDADITAGLADLAGLEIPSTTSYQLVIDGFRQTIGAIGPGLVDLIAQAERIRAEEEPLVFRPQPAAAISGADLATVGSAITLHGSARHFDPLAVITYTWDTDLDGDFDDGAGQDLSFTPPAPGLLVVGLRAADSAGYADIAYHALDVAPSNSPPEIVEIVPSDPSPAADVNDVLAFSVVAQDPDGDPLTIRWFVDGALQATVAAFSFVMPDATPHLIAVEVADTDPLSADAIAAFTVRPASYTRDTDGDAYPDGIDVCPSSSNPLQDLSSDAANCGSCGNVCQSASNGSNGMGSCVNSACVLTCNIGYRDCNGDFSDGCECTVPPNVSFSASASTIREGLSTMLMWSSTNATSCIAVGDWASNPLPPSGTQTVSPSVTTTYNISCTGPGGTDSSKIVTITVFPTPPPTLTFYVNPRGITQGASATLAWAAYGPAGYPLGQPTGCTASGGWTGTRPIGGSETVRPTETTTYLLTCTNRGGSITQQVTLEVLPPSQAVPFVRIDGRPIGVACLSDGPGGAEDRLVVTSYAPGNLHTVDSAGVVTTHNIPGFPSTWFGIEAYLAVSHGLGGWDHGVVYVAFGGTIYRVAPDFSSASVFATISPAPPSHAGITFDRTGVWGFDMIVSLLSGHVYRINQQGVVTYIASVNTTHESPRVLPDDTAKWGAFAGCITTSSENSFKVFAICPDGSVQTLASNVISAESSDVRPSSGESTFGTTPYVYFNSRYGDGRIWAYPASGFPAGSSGDMFVSREYSGGITRIAGPGQQSTFEFEIGQHYEGSNFCFTGGRVDTAEQCQNGLDDDGDQLVDGQDSDCFECGNSVVEVGEDCDDGNRFSEDGCDEMCRTEECGNFVVQVGEECDDGNLNGGDRCTSACRLPCLNSPSGLIHWWDGNLVDPSGRILDTEGGNNANFRNGASVTNGRDGNSFSFDGMNDHIVSTGNSSLTGNPSFTIEAWIRIPSNARITGEYPPILWWGSVGGGSSVFFSLHNRSPNRLFVGFYNGGQRMIGTFTNDEWHHVVYTRSGGGRANEGNTLYIDGVSVALGNDLFSTLTPNVTLSRFRIQDATDGRYFQGLVDDVRVYDRVLTAAEVATLASGAPANCCGNGVIDELEACDDLNTTDGDGCSSTCAFENLPPNAACRDVSVSTDPDVCTALASVNGGSSDPDGDPITFAMSPQGPFSLGSTSVALTVSDDHGESDTCTGTVTVTDTEPPSVSCPAPSVVECTETFAGTADPGRASATDNCASPTVNGPVGSSSYPFGTTPVTFSATDASGHRSECTTSVTVVDTTPPSIECPAPITAECTANRSATISVPGATVSDACGVASVNSVGPASYALGTTTVSFTATDESLNSASCTTAVTVRDTTPPVVVNPNAPKLWPPNHAHSTITLADCGVTVADACQGPLDLTSAGAAITCVTSDEPETGSGELTYYTGGGDGRTIQDIVIDSPTQVRVRAERRGGGDGRVYRIHYEVTDAQGNRSPGVCSVSVAHSQGDLISIDSGVAYSVCR